MPRLLSQEEIDALLTQVPEEAEKEPGGIRVAASGKSAQLYDFKRPDRLSKENVRSLHLIHDRFARSCSASFSAYLRTMSDVNLLSVDQFTYFEFLMSLPDPTCLNILSMKPLEGNAALEMNPSIVFPVIDKLLGGPGLPLAEVREMTDIEFGIIEGMLKRSLKDLEDAWSQAIKVEIAIVDRETTPQLMQIAAPNEPVVLVTFEIKIADLSGMMNLCIPSRMLEPVMNRFTQDWYSLSVSNRPEKIGLWINELLNEVPLPVSVFLGETKLAVQDIVNLEKGDIVVLGNHTSTPLTVRVGGVPKFRASIGEHGHRAAVKILSMIERPAAPVDRSVEAKQPDDAADQEPESKK
ncbi:MAG: flagellar motor switch protein FliM [Candidatus Coatesbacteria bacterium]|nr:MAG: flagellar motor switch protein FliM [Candidatus Coatesbacteria bacterium]